MNTNNIIRISTTFFGLIASSTCIAYEDTVVREFDFSGKADLRIIAEDSDVLYRGEDRDTVAVEVRRVFHKLNEEEAQEFLPYLILDFLESDEGLSIDTKPDFRRQDWRTMRYSQQVIIHGPRKINFTAAIEDGDLKLGSIEGTVTVNLEDGDFDFESIDGPLVLNLEDGNAKGSRLSGVATLNVEDGNTSFGQFLGKITADIVDGDMDVEFSDTPSGNCWIDIEDGQLKLKLPESIPANLILKVEDGKTRMGNLGSSVLLSSNSKNQIFALNGGGVEIAISVEDGNIDIN